MNRSLFDRPHREAAALVASGAPVVLCVDPVEYHGPHLSLHNDRQLSRGCMAELAQRVQSRHGLPLLLADHLELGVDPCAGPGSRPCAFSLVRDAVLASARALLSLGATRVVLMTFHGAPLHNLALEAGVSFLRRSGARALAPFHAVLQDMLAFDNAMPFAEALRCIDDDDERAAVARELRFDFHAGFFETSLALHWAPETVGDHHRALPPCPRYTADAKLTAAAAVARRLGREALARELEFGAAATGWGALRPFPGYTGRPHLARASAGAAFADIIVDRFATLMDTVIFGDAAPPKPVLAWTRWATAQGRLLPHAPLGFDDVIAGPTAATSID